MPGISMEGASGLSPEFQKAYSVAVQAEKKPIEQIEKRRELAQAKLELVNDLMGKVDGLKSILPSMNSPFALRELSLNSDDVKVLSGTADKTLAEPGKHPLEVLRLAGGASALSNALPDRDDTKLGAGHINFSTFDGESREVYIDAENSTLDGIASTINKAGLGVRASVIHDSTDLENPYKLMIATKDIGQSADVTFPEFYLTGGEEDLYMEGQQDATNAVIRYQGFEIQSPTNELKDLIPGATLNLKGLTDPGKPTTVTIEQDIPKTVTKMKDLVDRTNQILSFIQQQNTMDANTDTSRTLGGDYSMLLTEEKIRAALRENFVGVETRMVRAMSDLGVQFTKTGTLTFDEKKFENALQANYEQTLDLMVGDNVSYGVITKLGQALTSISSAGNGLITNTKNSLNNKVSQMNRQIEQKEKTGTQKLEALKNSLAKAQSALDSMQQQGNYFQGGGSLIPGA